MLQKYYSNGNCKCSSYFAVLLVVRTNSLLIERTILYQRNEMWRIEYITLLKFKSILNYNCINNNFNKHRLQKKRYILKEF